MILLYMNYFALYQVVPATFHVILWKIDFFWDSAADAAAADRCCRLIATAVAAIALCPQLLLMQLPACQLLLSW